MYRHLYQNSLEQSKEQLHLAAHSHHLWMDCTQIAHNQYYADSIQFNDVKWSTIFKTIIPETQSLIAENLNVGQHSKQLAFAPNTHELVFRLQSCLLETWIKTGEVPTVLTTDSEFHSFNRQTRRLEELGLKVHRIPVLPFNTFSERFSAAAQSRESWGMIFLSAVFFNSGFTADLNLILPSCKNKSDLIIVDGYHSFMARPLDWSPFVDYVYFLAGSYKYAQGGEGACFLLAPPNKLRPLYTGWYAEFGQLETRTDGIGYSNDGFKFAGSTFDPSGIYRLNASLKTMKENGLTVEKIHDYSLALQEKFLKLITNINVPGLDVSQLIVQDSSERGNFLAFRCNDAEEAKSLQNLLMKNKIYTDCRQEVVRFGFGLYHNWSDIEEAFEIFK